MTLTRDDIKLMASERLNDDPDGGGYMTGTTIQDGVENNLFPDISEIDRAQGAVDYRKAFVFLGVNNQDTYFGANVILDGLAADTAVTALMVESESISEVRLDMLTRLNTAGEDAVFYGMKPLTVSGTVNDRSVQLNDLRTQFIPPSSAAVARAGAVLPVENNARTSTVYHGDETLDSTVIVPGYEGVMIYLTPILYGAGVASVTGGAVYKYVKAGGREYVVAAGHEVDLLGAIDYTGPGFYQLPGVDSVNGVVATFGARQTVEGPLVQETHTYTVGGPPSRAYTLAHLPAEGSETISWTDGTNNYVLKNLGPSEFPDSEFASASVDRSTGLLVVEFLTEPANGSTVTLGYTRKDETGHMAAPTWTAGQADLGLSGGFEMAEVQLTVSGERCRVVRGDNVVRKMVIDTSGPVPRLIEGGVVGSYDPSGTGTLSVVGATNATVTGWHGTKTKALSAGLTGTVVTAVLPTLLEPTTLNITGLTSGGTPFSISPDSDGYFTGTATGRYVRDTGALNLIFGSAIRYASLRYDGDQIAASLVSETIAGVNPALFPPDGRVLVVRSGMIAVVHNTQTTSATTVSNGSVINCGRTRIADARVFGSDGIEIRTGFTVSKTAGTVTFTDVSGYHNPVTVVHRVEDLSVILSAAEDGAVTLSKPLTHTFPSGTSYLSTALQMGDLQAHSHPGFQMATWTGTWADDLAGSGGTAILADYNEATHPVIVQNQGAITERWVIIFTNVTAFKVIGEQVGQIAVGDTATNCSPVNPATGQPYFTIEAAGWGSGWAIGNCYRFNTDGGSAPFWTIRSIAPSDPFETQDHITVAARGSINA